MGYLFLAFTTSTAFGPTDVLTLSRRAKVLVMLQVGTSFASFGVLAARAISIIRKSQTSSRGDLAEAASTASPPPGPP